MQNLLEIVFERMEPSDAVRARIEKEASRLERFNDRITSGRVVVTAPGHRRQHGGLFGVRIHLVLPGGKEVIAERNPSEDHSHEDAYVAIRDAFAAARRQLQDKTRRQRGKVKSHETPPHGKVTKLFPEEGYGFIETPSGDQIYFHQNSVVNDGFGKLDIGSQVRFTAQDGEQGPQASTVHIVGKHHPT